MQTPALLHPSVCLFGVYCPENTADILVKLISKLAFLLLRKMGKMMLMSPSLMSPSLSTILFLNLLSDFQHCSLSLLLEKYLCIFGISMRQVHYQKIKIKKRVDDMTITLQL